MAKRLIFILGISCTIFFLIPLVKAQNLKVYSNKDWGFSINIPEDWYFTEANQIIEQSNKDKQSQKLELIKESGLIVSISKFPFNQKVDFNPNINISAKNIELSPKPNTTQIVDYAKQILLSLVQQKKGLSVREVKFNGVIGAETAYEYQMFHNNKNINIFALTVVLIDQRTNNYFIIVASCLKEKSNEFEKLFRETIRSFKLL